MPCLYFISVNNSSQRVCRPTEYTRLFAHNSCRDSWIHERDLPFAENTLSNIHSADGDKHTPKGITLQTSIGLTRENKLTKQSQ